MKRKLILLTAMILAIVLVQTTVTDHIKLFGVKPNLILVYIVLSAIIRGSFEGAVIGFFIGLAQDLLSGKAIGIYAIAGMYVGVLAGFIQRRVYRENLFISIFFTFAASLLYGIMTFLTLMIGGVGADFSSAFSGIIFPEAVYNSLISIPMFFIVLNLSRKADEISKSARKY